MNTQLIRLPLDRLVEIDLSKVSAVADRPDLPSLTFLLEGQWLVFEGDEYKAVKEWWVDYASYELSDALDRSGMGKDE